MWSPPWLRRDGVDRKAPSLAKEGRGGSKSSLFGKGGTGRIEKIPPFFKPKKARLQEKEASPR